MLQAAIKVATKGGDPSAWTVKISTTVTAAVCSADAEKALNAAIVSFYTTKKGAVGAQVTTTCSTSAKVSAPCQQSDSSVAAVLPALH